MTENVAGVRSASPADRISVVVATFDGARFVAEQLGSILAQTSPFHEIVVTDDGSRDETLAIIERVFTQAGWWGTERVSVVRNPGPRGVASNVAHGISVATGEIIVLADQDDVWHPNRLAAVREVFDHRPDIDLVHSDARLVDADGRDLGVTLLDALAVPDRDRAAIHRGRALDVLLRRNIVTGATSAFRRDVAVRAGVAPDGWIHDEWLAMVAAVGGRVELIERPLIDYRQHGGNQVGAEALGFRQRLARLGEPRAERNDRLLRRAQSLVTRLAEADWAPPSARRAAGGKRDHEVQRSRLPSLRIARVPRVLSGLVSGRYRRFSNGVVDAVRDLVQPG